MPIPINPARQRVNAPGGLNLVRPNAQPNALGELGDALGGAAQGIQQRQAFALQKQEEKAAVFANESLMSSRAKWVEELPKRQAEASESGEGFALGVLQAFDEDADERIKLAPTEQSRQYLKQRLSETRLAIQQDSLQFEAKRGIEYKTAGLDRANNTARTVVEFSPQTFATVLAEQRAAIQASGLPEDVQAKAAEASQYSLASAAVEGVIRRDPYKALKDLNNEKTDSLAVKALDFDRRQQLRNKAETEINRIETERRVNRSLLQQELSIQMQDARAAAGLGLPVTVPERSQLVAAFGEPRGDAYYKQLIGVQGLSAEVGKLNQLSNAQLEQLGASYTPTQQEGAADQIQLSNTLNSRIGHIIAQRKADPVAYLQDISPTVGDALAKATANEPGSGVALFNAVEAEKDRLGIYSPNVFPKGLVPGSDEFQQTALLAANKYRALPAEAATYAANALKSDDPATVAKAAQLLDAANNIAPASVTSVAPQLRAKAELVARMVNSGAAPDRAVQTAVDALKVTPQVAEQRRIVYKEQRKANPGKLDGYINDTFDAGLSGLFSSQPVATQQLQGDFEGQVSAYFEQTGDIDVARDLAWQDLQRVYGPSEINGSKQMTAFPLERFTVTPEQARKEIADLILANPQADQSNAEEITIVADSDTLRFVSDAMSGARVRPSYRMVTKTGDLVRDKDGLPLRYFIPSDEQILETFAKEQRNRQEQTDQGVEQAKFDRLSRKRREKLSPYGIIR
jgi:hypothetical protein